MTHKKKKQSTGNYKSKRDRHEKKTTQATKNGNKVDGNKKEKSNLLYKKMSPKKGLSLYKQYPKR